jgi:hypothetical protein
LRQRVTSHHRSVLSHETIYCFLQYMAEYWLMHVHSTAEKT